MMNDSGADRVKIIIREKEVFQRLLEKFRNE